MSKMHPIGPLVRAALFAAAVSLSGQAKATSAPKPKPDVVLELNTAPVSQLVRLPGIGPKRARQIVERRKRKPFRSVREILSIKGIGPKTYARLKRRLKVSRTKRAKRRSKPRG